MIKEEEWQTRLETSRRGEGVGDRNNTRIRPCAARRPSLLGCPFARPIGRGAACIIALCSALLCSALGSASLLPVSPPVGCSPLGDARSWRRAQGRTTKGLIERGNRQP